ncbi:unnamed protein product, partial [Effrenium voratum]
MRELVNGLKKQREELAGKQEAVAAACLVEKERLAELRNDFQEVRASTTKKIEAATKELAAQECAASLEERLLQIDRELKLTKDRGSSRDMQALKLHQAEAANLQKRIEESQQREQE